MVNRLVVAVLLAVCPLGAAAVAQTPRVGDVAPSVMVADLLGKPVRVGLASGKRAAVVEFWATWCELCHALLPEMRAAHAHWGDRVDFFGVNVTVNDGKEHVRRYIAETPMPFVTVYDDKGVAVRAFGAVATSHVVIVDATGHIAYIGDGADQKISAELSRIAGK